MSRKTKTDRRKKIRELKSPCRDELDKKREKYREGIKNNPPPMDDSEMEMKECEGCYCQMFASNSNNGYSFCSGCLGCETMDCPGGCCDCYSDGSRGGRGSDGKISKGTHRGKEKKLSFVQKQRLHGEQVIQNAGDMIEKIKDYEDTDDMLTAKKIEDIKRGTQQEKEYIIKNLIDEELGQELIKRKKAKLGKKNEPIILMDECEREGFLRNFTEIELYQAIERKKSLHKKMFRKCQSCRKETDDGVEMDLDMLECQKCYEANNKGGNELNKKAEAKRIERGEEEFSGIIEARKKAERGCYDWCADDCPQQFVGSKKK